MRILFIDPECPEPADWQDLDRKPLGGTESTVLRVAEGLAQRSRVEITVAQIGRTETVTSPAGVSYIGWEFDSTSPLVEKPDMVVVLRSFKILKRTRAIYPDANLTLWMHCFPGSRWKRAGTVVEDTDTNILAVSDTLAQRMREMLSVQLPDWAASRRVITIHNPLSPNVRPLPGVEVDENKLVYFSSPHKGLPEVLEIFSKLHRVAPEMQLYTADPGYWRGGGRGECPGVVTLGPLPQPEVHRHVQEALCVFYPQTHFEETFGLVFAEANALGTPVIAHSLGATEEVLNAGAPGQIVDCTDHEAVIETVMRWRFGERPKVHLADQFTLSHVLDRWQQLLAGKLRPEEPLSQKGIAVAPAA